jgi:protein SCO1/2
MLAVLAVLAWACGSDSKFYQAQGLVEEVQADTGQVVIAHGDIEDFMPAMTMNFDVPDPALRSQLAPGQRIDFTVEFTGHSYRVVAATVTGEASESDGWIRLGAGLVRADPAPAFDLTDQRGAAFRLGDAAGKIVLLDFIYTRCPGPCPILSRNHVTVQRSLSDELQQRTWFISVSLDPEHDTSEVLRAYAEQHGMAQDNWSLLTGAPDEVAAVVKSYGVGSVRAADGVTIDHRVASFLIDSKGRIARRYFGLEHTPGQIVDDLTALAG